MSLRLLSLGLLFAAAALHGQFYNWGWGPPITVDDNGSSIECSVFDPILNTTRTESFSNVDVWSYDDGVVATVSSGGTVTGIVYDIHLGTFTDEQFSSNSGNVVINSDGVVAWVSSSGTVGAAIYDPVAHTWRDEQFSSNTGNAIQNRDGVVSWVSSAGTLGAAVYDPQVGQWQDEQFSSNTGNVLQNRDGIVGWVSDAGTLGAAVYDPSIGQWQDEQFSSNTGNVLVLGQGVVAWKSEAGTLGGAAYNWSSNSWDDEQFSSSSSNTTPTITDGTIQWTNSQGLQKYGYTSGNDWQENANTAVRCSPWATPRMRSGARPSAQVLPWVPPAPRDRTAAGARRARALPRRPPGRRGRVSAAGCCWPSDGYRLPLAGRHRPFVGKGLAESRGPSLKARA